MAYSPSTQRGLQERKRNNNERPIFVNNLKWLYDLR